MTDPGNKTDDTPDTQEEAQSEQQQQQSNQRRREIDPDSGEPIVDRPGEPRPRR